MRNKTEWVGRLRSTNIHFYCMLLGLSIAFASCGTSQKIKTGPVRPLNKIWKELNLDTRYHVGLSIYDLKKGKTIFRYRDDNYFTPASNTKILTLYASLLFLEDNLDAAWFAVKGDSLIIWGGGDPGTLYPERDTSAALIEFLKASDKTIIFSNAHFRTLRYGPGWAWDDHPFAYQCERTALPIYGNRIWIDRLPDSVVVTPSYFNRLVSGKKGTHSYAGKTEWGESYFYVYDPDKQEDHFQIPITYFKNDMAYCWSEVTGKSIIPADITLSAVTFPIAGSARDTLLKIMMQETDNFIAEQLLLACSMKALKYMSEKAIIDSIMKGTLDDLPDKIKWVDGSGLSTYNQMTPRSLVMILQKIIQEKGLDYITSIFPAGGQSGTLRDWYKGNNGQPYVFAKSGTLSSVQCLSGILFTRSGKILVFSWMHNHFTETSAEVKEGMDTLLKLLYNRY